MAFSWSTVTQYTTPTSGGHITELRTNINHVRTHVGLGAYSWTKTITNYPKIDTSDWSELKTALDAAHTANVCSVDNVTYYNGHCDTYYASDNASQFTDHYHTNYTTDYTPNYSSHCETYYASDNASNYSYFSAHYDYCSPNYAYWGTHYGSVYASYNSSHCPSNHTYYDSHLYQ